LGHDGDSQNGQVTARIAPIRIGARSVWPSPRPHRIGWGGARYPPRYPRWQRNVQVGEFHSKGKRVVNRAYPERNPALSAPDRNKNPGFRRRPGMDYQISTLKALSQNDRKQVAQSTSWRPYLTWKLSLWLPRRIRRAGCLRNATRPV